MKKSTKIPKASARGVPGTVEWKRLTNGRRETTSSVAPTPVPQGKKRKVQHLPDDIMVPTMQEKSVVNEEPEQENKKTITVSDIQSKPNPSQLSSFHNNADAK